MSKTSDKQIEANQANARKSTGPRTAAGKARSSKNAVKHGLYAKDVVVPSRSTKELEGFNQLHERLFNELQPANPLEELLVERLVVAHWRLRRAYRQESVALKGARICYRIHNDPKCYDGQDIPRELPYEEDIEDARRYEQNVEFSIDSTMRQLLKLRASAHLFEKKL